MTTGTLWLLALLLVSHFLGDFTPLSTPRMREAKARGRPVGPIAAHALVHMVLLGLSLMVAARPAGGVLAAAMGIELVTHFGIDWSRGLLGARFPSLSDSNTQAFWSALGLDQLSHGLVLIWITWMVA